MSLLFFHEATQEQIEEILVNNWGLKEVKERYKQPSWCQMEEALHVSLGCWSLTDFRNGGREKISAAFCSDCDYCKRKEVMNGKKAQI